MSTNTVIPSLRPETIIPLSKTAHTTLGTIPIIFIVHKLPLFQRSRTFVLSYYDAVLATTAHKSKPIPISIFPDSIPTDFLRLL